LKNDNNMPEIPVSFNIAVDKISLMKSEQLNGVLKYTAIYNKNLGNL